MRLCGFGLMVCVWAAAATAQTVPVQSLRTSSAQPPVPADVYVYEPGHRRDPFVSPIGVSPTATVVEPRLPVKKGEGLAGLTVAEIAVRGVMESRGVFVAMVQGPATRTFLVHAGDKVADGTIKAITAQGLVIVQDVADPLSLVKHQEILKRLRSFEPVKE